MSSLPPPLLIVEDDPALCAYLAAALGAEGYAVRRAQDRAGALSAFATPPSPEIVLLDLGLPRKSGLDLLASLRRKGVALPVLVITARDSVADRVKGLDAGADDYLVKPFDLDELSARIRALMRRHGGRASPVIEHGALTLNPATHEVTLAGLPVSLSGREFALLHALVEQAGHALWLFLVQRDACGLRDAKAVMRDYRVPPQVQACAGAFPTRRSTRG